MVEFLLAVAIVVLVAWFITAPLRHRPRAGNEENPAEAELADLEARKEALYRQIRDAELDREQGKLSAADWERLDAELRREAIELLKRIDAAGERPV
jgi:hypothetical protein